MSCLTAKKPQLEGASSGEFRAAVDAGLSAFGVGQNARDREEANATAAFRLAGAMSAVQ